MRELARHKSCPPAALTIIFNNVMSQKVPPNWYTFPPDIEDTLVEIAHRSDTPPELLVKLLHVERSADVRMAALKNPNVPRPGKIAYEETLCGGVVKDFHNNEELRFAASDPDTPPPTLECFAAQWTRFLVASNPHTPIPVLERLTGADVETETRKAAQKNIHKRGAAKQ